MSRKAVSMGFRKRVGWAAVGILVLHLVLCLFVVTNTSKRLRNTLPGIFYHDLVLAGPFFREDIIPYSTHFYYRYKPVAEPWNGFVDMSQKQFQAYNRQQWRYSGFIRTVYLNRQANDLGAYRKRHRIDLTKPPVSLKRINQYLVHHAGDTALDSVTVLAVRYRYDLVMNGPQPDTLFVLTYSPSQLETPY